MSTPVSHWTIPAESTGRYRPEPSRRVRAISVPAVSVALLPLVGTLAVTKLAMLAVIVWASPDLRTDAVIAAMDVTVVFPLAGPMGWLLLLARQGQARAQEGE